MEKQKLIKKIDELSKTLQMLAAKNIQLSNRVGVLEEENVLYILSSLSRNGKFYNRNLAANK